MRFLLFLHLMSWSILASAQTMTVDLGRVRARIIQWNEANNNKDFAAFRTLYADTVLYYTKYVSKEVCVANKTRLLSSIPNYHQQIITDLLVTVHTDGIIYCRFTKELVEVSEPSKYPSYLLLKQKQNNYVIVGESDLETDRDHKFYLSLNELKPASELTVVQADNKKSKPVIQVADNVSNRFWFLLGATVFTLLLFVVLLWARKNKSLFGVTAPQKREKQSIHFQVHVSVLFRQHVKQLFSLQDQIFTLRNEQTDTDTQSNFPDLIVDFSEHNQNSRFAVVCRYNEKKAEETEIMSVEEHDRCHRFQFESGMDIYVVLGLGGQPNHPEELYVMHFNELSSSHLSQSQLQAYRKHTRSFTFDPINNKLA